MSFTAVEIISIGAKVEIDAITLKEHIGLHDTEITTDVEDAVRDQLTMWDANDLDTDFDVMVPNLRNFGGDSDAGRLRAAIRKRISLALFLPMNATGGSNWGYAQRA